MFSIINGNNVSNIKPQQIPVISIAAPNMPATPLYFGSTHLKTTL